ncbi:MULTISPECIES: M13 family metallopeptidase [Bacteroidaceae]|uniref:M13 family metallopeptidase n=1 Tax=Bacteroidaceae TaxID=815 RepID=UPI0003379249|nr:MULTISPECIES: M13 family metallopeptidase [Bacteroides]CCZ70743.1 endothelin-converting enzyme 1 [Bacteroides sp. CAG:702]MBM6658233.1 M13 family metallopeptidase [Bacteroides gallinaceum]MBM6720004.1 M13 family metallopeptidase [Bacteroides gallinaceum]MBM6944174.1 M13 family metallopeptidase [Bacteroides gallinaceum]MDN0066108.1 M13 family metallopeptidase [Bacteroides gallinaceum]
MKTKHYVAVAAFATLAMAGCTGQKNATNTSGIDLANMDTTVSAGTDFFRYACGGWNDAHPLTAEYSRYGTFDQLAENNQKQLRGLIEELAAKQNEPGTAAQKIGDLYNMAMDSVTLNKQGCEPVKPMLEKIAALTDKSQVIPMAVEMRRTAGIGTFFSYYVYADPKNSVLNIFQMGQGGINLGEKEYYLDNDSITQNIREQYKKYIAKLFTLAGFTETDAQQKVADVMEIETAIAKVSKSATELRDPEANYHKMTYAELKKQISGIDWDAFMKALGIEAPAELNVEQIEPIQEVAKLINTLPLSKSISYLEYNLLDAAAPTLSDDFVTARFDFYGKVMSGRQANQPRWKRAVNSVDGLLGELVGEMYVEKYFPAAAKERMVNLVKNLQTALGQRIDAQEWMSDSTKMRAHEKLDAFRVKVGYPDKWKDYSALEIQKDSYWANVCRAAAWGFNDMISRLGKPVDRDEWLMTPQTVNAYYNPSTNEICFPAAILQPPFFNMEADDAANYGAIGVVIGHEMTHGFDDQGRQFDKEGNLKDWWAAGDADRFKERAQVMVDFFNNIEVLPGLHGNGQLTLGENLADHGGLNIAYLAFQNATKDAPLEDKNGFTPAQRFFIAYATLWAGNIRDEQIRVYTKSDPHSLGEWRVNGALPHIQAWYDAFNITPNDPLYVAPEKRVNIW